MVKKNVDKKVSLLDRASDLFITKIKQIEKRVFSLVNSLLKDFTTENGRFRNISANRRKLISLDNAILSILNEARLGAEVSVYLKNFDEIERLNRLIYEGFLDATDIGTLSRMGFDLQRLDIIEQVVLGLTNPNVLKVNVANPIRKFIIQSVAMERGVAETEKLLRQSIISTEGQSSEMLRYVRTITQDAVSQYDGALNDAIRDELELDGFAYVGSVVKATRQNCFDMVRGTGKYKEFAIHKGVYRVADIPKIIERARRCEIHHSTGKNDCGSGFNAAVTPQTFATYRMGYGCRHTVLYIRLIDSDVPEAVKNAL